MSIDNLSDRRIQDVDRKRLTHSTCDMRDAPMQRAAEFTPTLGILISAKPAYLLDKRIVANSVTNRSNEPEFRCTGLMLLEGRAGYYQSRPEAENVVGPVSPATTTG